MSDSIGNIFYFGSPKDGFKVYPDLGPVSNVFSGYYTNTNTESEWILVVRKSEAITRYTYVRYGLLTSLVEGRTGSCFGISIDFVNCYFTDLKVFLTDIFEGLWGAILDEKQLLEVQGSSGKVAFKSYDLHDVALYLDGISNKIKEVIRNQKYSAYVRPSYEIPQAGDNQVYGLHPHSSSSAMIEYFRMYGAVKLAPNLPIETKSLAEKQEEDRENLKKKVEELNEQLRQKDRELHAANQKFEKLLGLVKPIVREFPTITTGNESHGQVVTSRSVSQSDEPLSTSNHRTHLPAVHNPYQDAELSPRAKKVLMIVGVAAILLALITTIYIQFFDTDEPIKISQPAQPTTQPAVTVATPDPVLIFRQNRRDVVVLNESAFLDSAHGKPISGEEDFKDALTTFLFSVSPEIRDFYNGNKDNLWTTIVEKNPNSTQKLRGYLNVKRRFTIENNAEQKDMLRGLEIDLK
jgi:hypothetical protein